jgi:hypothetical protein
VEQLASIWLFLSKLLEVSQLVQSYNRTTEAEREGEKVSDMEHTL